MCERSWDKPNALTSEVFLPLFQDLNICFGEHVTVHSSYLKDNIHKYDLTILPPFRWDKKAMTRYQ